jgi:hypothetical protein
LCNALACYIPYNDYWTVFNAAQIQNFPGRERNIYDVLQVPDFSQLKHAYWWEGGQTEEFQKFPDY